MVGFWIIKVLDTLGTVLLMLGKFLVWSFVPPFRWGLLLKQIEFVGVKSTAVVLLTGSFTGMVLALQTHHGLEPVGAEAYIGTVVTLGMLRELGPVLTSLMVAARAGSSMAAELASMRVTEQIDALTSLAVEPLKYLVVPRIWAGIIVVPILTGIANFFGVLGGYFVSVHLLGVNPVLFMRNAVQYSEVDDLFNGLIKAAVFGLILTLVSCFTGFYARGGAEGVGRATTTAVVASAMLIIAADYFLTAIMF
ncbi:MAG: ABC transporter permease [Candidatus Coatesbacteria bacterium]|nr:ABC transporter permease [Candidatus Coatesbacteria bacterium]